MIARVNTRTRDLSTKDRKGNRERQNNLKMQNNENNSPNIRENTYIFKQQGTFSSQSYTACKPIRKTYAMV